ncbi:laccase-6 isoform X2 [Cephus cinctus]|nr:laccase-6 isoform X2 [Cephus cinctus]XP_024946732.1 laccase-6 isoform X2 [Cephus cinctus]XP_024946733.1 laccase-6 isoform X2 [Cephus cinctus]
MDGVSMVSQCPIFPFGAYRYEMKADTAGTYFYSAHLVTQQGDGLYGSLIVREARNDPKKEWTLLVASKSSVPMTGLSYTYPTAEKLLLNGQTGNLELFVENGNNYMLRFINANVFHCPVSVTLARHRLKVLTVDGNMVEPTMTGTHIIIFPGERFDLIVSADQSAGRYLLNIQGLQECRHLIHEAYLNYGDSRINEVTKDTDYLITDNDVIATVSLGYDCNTASENIICAMDLKHLKMKIQMKGLDERHFKQPINTLFAEEPEETIYVPFDLNSFDQITDSMTDYRYNIYGFTYYPAYLSLLPSGGRISQINGVTFKYPTSPILSQPENTPEEQICSVEGRSNFCKESPLFCECIQIIEVQPDKLIEVILIDEGFGGDVSHTFHVHGYNVSIVGLGTLKRPISKEEIMALNDEQQLFRNLLDPPMKDTFTVPNKGYAILRFYTDNRGYWLWEARSTGIAPTIYGPGMQFLMRVGTRENMPTVPIDFPSCGNNKRPDMIFESH